MMIPEHRKDTVTLAEPLVTNRPPPSTLPANCALRLLLDQLGGKWSICVLLSLADGPVRFNELKRTIEGVTQKMLGQTLRRLEFNGLVERRAYATTPMRVEYVVTGLGRTLTPVIRGLQAWAHENAVELASARERFEQSDPYEG